MLYWTSASSGPRNRIRVTPRAGDLDVGVSFSGLGEVRVKGFGVFDQGVIALRIGVGGDGAAEEGPNDLVDLVWRFGVLGVGTKDSRGHRYVAAGCRGRIVERAAARRRRSGHTPLRSLH